MSASALDGLRNLFGPLSPEVRARLAAVLADPTDATWDDASSIIVTQHDGGTLWQWVLEVDPSFPRVGPTYNDAGERVKPWARIPDPFTLRRALHAAREANAARWGRP